MKQLLFLGRLFLFDDFPPVVMAAFGADDVGQVHLAAVGAGDELELGERVVRAATVAAAFGVFTFWMWGHGYSLSRILRQGRRAAPLRMLV